MPTAGLVLVIGDDDELLNGLRESPALAGYELQESCGSCDAVQLVRSRAFDVVVTNPRTAIREDLALIEALRSARPGVRIVLMAPHTAPDDVVAAVRAHVFASFGSPFDVQEVASMVARAVETPDWHDGIEVVSGLPNWTTLRVSCRLVSAERLVHFMHEARSDLPEEDREAIITALREMLLNAMEHGAQFDPDKVVEVTAARTERALVFHIKDPGPGFDPSRVPHAAISNPDDPAAHLDARAEQGMRPGGFGMLVAKQVVDELVYNERGNEVLLIKHTA